jgi:hypothetical protein
MTHRPRSQRMRRAIATVVRAASSARLRSGARRDPDARVAISPLGYDRAVDTPGRLPTDPKRSSGFLFALLPAVVATPLVSGYLVHHEVGTALTRALIVGGSAALLVLVMMLLLKPRPFRSRLAPLWVGLVMALATTATEWLSAHL